MKAKKFKAYVSLLLGLSCWLLVVSCGKTGSEAKPAEKVLYTCGMHPQIVQDHPGNCPICGMKLTPKRSEAAATAGHDMNDGNSSTISVDPVTIQKMGIRTGTVVRGPVRRTVRTVGTVDFDETSLADVTTKFRGWIEKMDVDSTGRQVHKNEPLFEIYAPELYSAQTEYVLALNQAPDTGGADTLKATALTKLKFFDVSDEQIAQLEKTRVATKTLRVNAPRDGIVIEKMAVEGQMVEAGMKMDRLADLGIVWVQAQIYEEDLAFVELGQEASVGITYMPDRTFRGRVTGIYPTLDEKTRTARVRIELHNPGYYLKPGMFATVELTCELNPSALLVPDVAVLRSGERNTVFVAREGGKFDPRTVTLGPRSENDRYQVLSGLSEGERVVTSGQFMFDSESQLRAAMQKMTEPGKVEEPTNKTQPPAETEAEGTVYLCPMPEHLSIEYNRPGQCPLCGMTLVPVKRSDLKKIQPGGKLLYYTCPMPEHSDVHYDKPGKCAKCGMTLIPVMESPPPPEMGHPAARH